MRRYKDKDWDLAYKHSRHRLKVFLTGPGLNVVIAMEAQALLKYHYRGPWRMIAAMTKRELTSLWISYGWPKWEWIRVKIFRRPQDEAIEMAERVAAEEEELMRIGEEM